MSTTTMAKRPPSPPSRIKGVDWTGQKRTSVNVELADDVTVGEVAELLRDRMALPRGSYAVYLRDQKLNRSAGAAESGLAEDTELELSPEVKAGAPRSKT